MIERFRYGNKERGFECTKNEQNRLWKEKREHLKSQIAEKKRERQREPAEQIHALT